MLAGHTRPSGAIVQQGYVNLARQRLHYYVWGDHGSPVVLVHATGFHGYVWKPIAEGLSRDHRVVALDQRGHGDSGKPESGYSWDVFAGDLQQFLVALRLSAVDAVGHSAGATAIALCAAAHPGVIRRAVLIDPILYPRVPDGHPLRDNPLTERVRKRRMVWENRTSLFQSYRQRPPFSTWREEILWAYIEEGTSVRPDGHIELKCPSRIEAQIYEMAPTADGFSALPRVDIPVLLLRGESSDSFPETSAQLARSLLPQAQLKTISRATHFVPMERPDAVERAVRRFFAQ